MVCCVMSCCHMLSKHCQSDDMPVLSSASHSHIQLMVCCVVMCWVNTVRLMTHLVLHVQNHSHLWLMACSCVVCAGIEWTLSNWRRTRSFPCELFSCVGTPVSGSSPLQLEKCWPLWLCPLTPASLTLLMPLLKVSGEKEIWNKEDC